MRQILIRNSPVRHRIGLSACKMKIAIVYTYIAEKHTKISTKHHEVDIYTFYFQNV